MHTTIRCIHLLALALIAVASAVTLTSCSESDRAQAQEQQPPDTNLAGLPALSELGQLAPASARRTSTVVHELLSSAPLFAAEQGVSYNPGQLGLDPPSVSEMAWAIYGVSGLPTDGSVVPTLLTIDASSTYWLAVSNYTRGRWAFINYRPDGQYTLADGQQLVSDSGSTYVAVIAWDDPSTLTQLNLTTNDTSEEPLELWFYLQKNLYVPANLQAAIELVQRAAAEGYTTVVLADFKLSVIDLYGQDYYTALSTFCQAADAAGVEVVPALVPIGYSDAFFCHDPNLIEPQPVVDCLYELAGGQADVSPDPATVVLNGGFEQHNSDDFTNWNQMDGPGVSTFADTTEYHSGGTSIRFENFSAGNPHGNDRIRQDLTVKPWHCYALTFWLKTEGVVPASSLWIRAFKPDISGLLSHNTFNISSTQDWTQYHLIFNSQENTTVPIYIGIWSGESGRFWIDDVSVENAGLINLVRRDGTPLTVTSEDGLTTYVEGTDFQPVADPLLGEAGSYTGTFDLYHERPVIQLTPGSAISEGERLLVDYYHAVFVYNMQGACCLTDEGVYDIIEATLGKVDELVNPQAVFISVDELRVANWCAHCQATGKTPGQLLADATQRIDQIAQEIHPGWQLLVWSDMYDPYHNAHDDYYLANGTFAGSWEGLPTSWDIGNWRRFGDRTETLAFFADRGHRQVLAGFYDESGPDFTITAWLDDAADYPGVYAAMYTTWRDDYSQLEAWAQAVHNWE